MTHNELAKELGLPVRTLHRYKKETGWPADLDGQREFVSVKRGAIVRGRGAVRTNTVGGGLQARKLNAEVELAELKVARGREKILSEAREELRAEARTFLSFFHDAFHRWAKRHKLTNAQRRELNTVLEDAMQRLAAGENPPE